MTRCGYSRAWPGILLSLLLSAAGCSGSSSPEEQFRATLAQMEAAAESRSVGDFMDHVSENYNDAQSRNRDDIRRLAQIHMLRNSNLHIYRHVTQLNLVEDQSAQVIVLVALAGSPVESAESLADMRAELMEFNVEFLYEDSWKVVSAEWNRAGINDFLD